jgi:hypothetical protein
LGKKAETLVLAWGILGTFLLPVLLRVEEGQLELELADLELQLRHRPFLSIGYVGN